MTEKQENFAHYYLKTHDAYKSALKAGYSKNTAKNAQKNIVEKRGFQEYIKKCKRAAFIRKHRHEISDEDVIFNAYSIASGATKTRHYKLKDNNDNSQSTDQTMTGPPSIRDQVNAIDLVFQFRGFKHTESKPLEDAQIRKINESAKKDRAETKKANADAKMKQLQVKQTDTSSNRIIMQSNKLLDKLEKYGKNHKKRS